MDNMRDSEEVNFVTELFWISNRLQSLIILAVLGKKNPISKFIPKSQNVSEQGSHVGYLYMKSCHSDIGHIHYYKVELSTLKYMTQLNKTKNTEEKPLDQVMIESGALEGLVQS